jgi:hypothetical protein
MEMKKEKMKKKRKKKGNTLEFKIEPIPKYSHH